MLLQVLSLSLPSSTSNLIESKAPRAFCESAILYFRLHLSFLPSPFYYKLLSALNIFLQLDLILTTGHESLYFSLISFIGSVLVFQLIDWIAGILKKLRC